MKVIDNINFPSVLPPSSFLSVLSILRTLHVSIMRSSSLQGLSSNHSAVRTECSCNKQQVSKTARNFPTDFYQKQHLTHLVSTLTDVQDSFCCQDQNQDKFSPSELPKYPVDLLNEQFGYHADLEGAKFSHLAKTFPQ